MELCSPSLNRKLIGNLGGVLMHVVLFRSIVHAFLILAHVRKFEHVFVRIPIFVRVRRIARCKRQETVLGMLTVIIIRGMDGYGIPYFLCQAIGAKVQAVDLKLTVAYDGGSDLCPGIQSYIFQRPGIRIPVPI